MEGIKENNRAELLEKAINLPQAKRYYEIAQKTNTYYYNVLKPAVERDNLNFDVLLEEYDKFMSYINNLKEKESIESYLASKEPQLALILKSTYSSKDDSEVMALKLWNDALINTIAVISYCNYKAIYPDGIETSNKYQVDSSNSYLNNIAVSKEYIDAAAKELMDTMEIRLNDKPWLLPWYHSAERIWKIKQSYDTNDIESYIVTRDAILDNISKDASDSIINILGGMNIDENVNQALKKNVANINLSIASYYCISQHYYHSEDTYLDSNNVVRHRKN